jgi:hypothetical protein
LQVGTTAPTEADRGTSPSRTVVLSRGLAVPTERDSPLTGQPAELVQHPGRETL